MKSYLKVLVLLSIVYCLLSIAEAANIRFKIVAVNPSKVRAQRVPIKVYLPQEVKREDIVDLAGLNLEYDLTNSLFYVYKDDLYLEPAQTRIFEVEIKDIWVIPENTLKEVKDKINELLKIFEGTEYFEKMKDIAQRGEALLNEIVKSQSDESLSRSQHIGVYRTNVKALARLKEELSEMEKILQRERGPLTPQMLTKTKFKTESPTKTATWIAIFVIVFFLGILSVVVFFTWYRQAKATEKIISEVKKKSFLELGGKEEKKE